MPPSLLLLVHSLSLVDAHEYRLEEHHELQVVDRLARLERDDVDEVRVADVRPIGRQRLRDGRHHGGRGFLCIGPFRQRE